MPWTRALLAVAAVVSLAAACGDAGAGPPADVRATIVATTTIWADVVRNVACGDLALVQAVIPAGVDAHGFEPSLATRGQLESADLAVANGLGLEEALSAVIAAVEDNGTPVFRLADHVEALVGNEADPHIWFDPMRVSGALPALADRLVADAGLDADAVADCVSGYQAELAALDAEIQDLLSPIEHNRRLLVTNHATLSYFADRYGFEVIGTVIPAPSTLAETNPAQLEALALLMEKEGVTTIFAEESQPRADVDALRDRLDDVEVVTLRTSGLGDPDSGVDTYIGFLRTNARLIADALG